VALNAALVRGPQDFMQLNLKAHWQSVGDNPLG
jgi:hypothetical protein